jgi:hypothetical protein
MSPYLIAKRPHSCLKPRSNQEIRSIYQSPTASTYINLIDQPIMSSTLLTRAKSFTNEQLYGLLPQMSHSTTPRSPANVMQRRNSRSQDRFLRIAIPRVLLTLFAPGFAALFEDDESATLSNIEPEHFDVFFGWLRTRCSRDEGVWRVLGGGEWVCGSFSFETGADASHSSLLRCTVCGGGILLARLYYQVRNLSTSVQCRSHRRVGDRRSGD